MHRRPVSRPFDAARRLIVHPAAAGVAAALFPLAAAAAPADWIAGSGSWSTPGNWSGNAVPAQGQDVNIKHNDDVERVVNYDYAGPNIGLGLLTLDQLGRGPLRLSQRDFRLEAARTVIGNEGTGSFLQNGGAYVVNAATGDSFVLGNESTGNGDYTLAGGSLAVTAVTQIGSRGRGNLTVSGGAANVGEINIALLAGGSGTVSVNAGTLNVSSFLRIGGAGHGRYVQSGGNVTVAIGIAVDASTFDAPGSGTLHLTGGTLTITGNLNVNSESSTVIHDGTGLLSAREIYVGGNAVGDAGLYRFNNGRVDADSLFLIPRGTFEQFGGNLNVKNFLHNGGTVDGVLTNKNTYTYNSGAYPGKLVNQGTVVLNADLTIGNGLENQAPLTIQNGRILTLSAFSRNLSSLVLDGGTLASNNLLINLGNMTARGTLAGAGTFQNNGHLVQGDGDLTMTHPGGQGNLGTFDLAPGRKLILGSYLGNDGVLNLNDATIDGPGTFYNQQGGLISGRGVINAAGSNLGTIVVSSGALFLNGNSTNTGSLILDSATAKLDGDGRINNTGSIHGRGVVGAGVDNHGFVEAVGGTLTVGALPIASKKFNQFSDGTLAAGAGSQLHMNNGLGTNGGTILLTGGTFHDHGTSLNNTGRIRGNGVFRAAVLNSPGEITAPDGTLHFDATLNLPATAKVIVTGGASAVFHKNVTGVAGAELRVSTNSAAVFLAPVSGPVNFTGTGAKYFEAGASAVGPVAAGGTTHVLEAATLVADHFREHTLTISGKAAVRPNGTPAGTSKVNQLSIGPGGQLDLADNALILDYDPGPSPVTRIRSYLRSAYAAGAWTGPGLTSSNAAANPARAPGYGEASDLYGPVGGTFQGLPVDGSAVLVRFTIRGDANLDGTVNFPDLVALAQNYNTTDGSALWTGGDFTYDGNTTFPDLVALAQNYNTSLPAAGAIPGATEGFHEDLAKALAQVPEPSLLAPLALITAAFANRRRPIRRQPPIL